MSTGYSTNSLRIILTNGVRSTRMYSVMAFKKFKCKRGHRLVGWNLYKRKDGTRECKRCSLMRVGKRDRELKRQRQNSQNGNDK